MSATATRAALDLECADKYRFYERFLLVEEVTVTGEHVLAAGPVAVTVRVERPRVRLELDATVVATTREGLRLRFARADLERSAQLLGVGPHSRKHGAGDLNIVPRSTPRLQVQGRVWLPNVKTGLPLQNLGLGGMCFEIPAPLPLSGKLDAELEITGERRRIHVQCVVAWLGGAPGKLLVGVRFEDLGPGTRNRLGAVLDRRGRTHRSALDRRALLLSQDAELTAAYARAFAARDWHVVTATTGADAVALLRKQGFDALVLDLETADPDVRDVHRLVLLDQDLGHIVVILLGGEAHSPDSDALVEARRATLWSPRTGAADLACRHAEETLAARREF